MDNFNKWSEFKGVYSIASEVSNRLPPGVYSIGQSMGGGSVFVKKDIQSDCLYILPRSTTQLVMEELNKFWKSKEIFEKYGLLHKRGILLYGPPGTGKSSIINLVAREAAALGSCCFMMGGAPSVTARGLADFRKVHKDIPAIVFIEDVDGYCYDDEEDLLSILDGGSQINNVVFVATTNSIDKLPPRLSNRPSRFDRKIEIGCPEQEARYMYLMQLSKATEGSKEAEEYKKWSEKADGMSFAHLKEMFIAVRILENDFNETVEVLKKMNIDPPNDDEDDEEDNDY